MLRNGDYDTANQAIFFSFLFSLLINQTRYWVMNSCMEWNGVEWEWSGVEITNRASFFPSPSIGLFLLQDG